MIRLIERKTLLFAIILLNISLIISTLSYLLIFKSRINLRVLITPAILMVGIILTFSILYLGFRINEQKVKISLLFKSVIGGSIVFVVQYLLEFVWLLFNKSNYRGNEIANFNSFSIYQIFSNKQIPFYLIYPLQTLNLWEVANLTVMVIVFERISKSAGYINSKSIIIYTYLSSMFIYLLFTIFVNLSLVL